MTPPPPPPHPPPKGFTNATIYSQHRDPPTRLRATDGAQGQDLHVEKKKKKKHHHEKIRDLAFFSSLPFNSIGSPRRWGKICGKLHRGERKAPLIRHRSGHSNSAPEGGIEDWVQGCLGKKRGRGSTACLLIFLSLVRAREKNKKNKQKRRDKLYGHLSAALIQSRPREGRVVSHGGGFVYAGCG